MRLRLDRKREAAQIADGQENASARLPAAVQVVKQLGATEGTYWGWERNRTAPALRFMRGMPAGYPRELRTLANHVRRRRLDLGVMAEGLSSDT